MTRDQGANWKRSAVLAAITVPAMASFHLAYTIMPQVAGSAQAAGVANGTMMLAAILAEALSSRLTGLLSRRTILVLGLLLLGLPALLMAAPANPILLITASLLRGIGFGLTVVILGAIAASDAPAGTRGAALGFFGLVASLPAIVAMPLGVWIARDYGAGPAMLVSGALALLSIAFCPGLVRGRVDRSISTPEHPAGFAWSAILLFGIAALAAGTIASFATVIVAVPALQPAVLLSMTIATAGARWIAGRIGDRWGHQIVLSLSLALCALGLAGLSLGGAATALFAGALLFGAGFGAAQTASFALLADADPTPSGYTRASAGWNLVYDIGYLVSAVALAPVIATSGRETLVGLALLCLMAATPTWLLLHRRQSPAG